MNTIFIGAGVRAVEMKEREKVYKNEEGRKNSLKGVLTRFRNTAGALWRGEGGGGIVTGMMELGEEWIQEMFATIHFENVFRIFYCP